MESAACVRDVVAFIIKRLTAPRDIIAAASVCKTWRDVALDTSNLLVWTLDDDVVKAEGTKAPEAAMHPKTPLPKHWINPTTYSPLAKFKTPRSLQISVVDPPSVDALTPQLQEACCSPRTPSPMQPSMHGSNFLEMVAERMLIGRFHGEVDLSSSRLSDQTVQLILKSCPRLHTLRLQHVCGRRLSSNRTIGFLQNGDIQFERTGPLVTHCGCGQLSDKAFSNIHLLCPDLASVTLVLQHVTFRIVYRRILVELGALPKLNVLSIELRMPCFGQSMKSEIIWQEHARCGDKEIMAIIKAGPPPLQALALNRCELSAASLEALSAACPDLQAVDLHGDFEPSAEPGFPPTVATYIKGLSSLTAAAFGVFEDLEQCQFGTWDLPMLKRLRIESRHPLSLEHLLMLKTACPKLESVHLIWSTFRGFQEAHMREAGRCVKERGLAAAVGIIVHISWSTGDHVGDTGALLLLTAERGWKFPELVVGLEEDLKHIQVLRMTRNLEAVNPASLMEDRVKDWGGHRRREQFQKLRTAALKKQEAIDRTFQFWTQVARIYAGYKVTQLRVAFVKEKAEKIRIWDERHEIAADQLYSMCSNLGGFFLKTAQLLAKPDLSPLPWVKKLVLLCDQAPETPFQTVQETLESQLGKPMDTLFERFDRKPVGSASVAQVHRARLTGASGDVAVKVQHPGAEELMMTDIRNQKAFAAFLQRFDVQFDLVTVINELEEQVAYEFDFTREAQAMDRIGQSLTAANRGKPPVFVPRPVPGMVTRRVLVMDFIEGTSIIKLGDEMAKRGINPDGRVAKIAKWNILRDLTAAYGQMILRDGFFQADPHPGNVLINSQGKVALLDYGQTKQLTEKHRLGFAKIVMGLATRNVDQLGESFSELEIDTGKSASEDPKSFLTLASLMFDTKLPPGITVASPFGDDTILKAISVENFPKDMFFVLRTVHLLRGLSLGMGIPYSSSEMWKSLAGEALASAGLLKNPTAAPAKTSNYLFKSGKVRDGSPRKFMRDKRRTSRTNLDVVA